MSKRQYVPTEAPNLTPPAVDHLLSFFPEIDDQTTDIDGLLGIGAFDVGALSEEFIRRVEGVREDISDYGYPPKIPG